MILEVEFDSKEVLEYVDVWCMPRMVGKVHAAIGPLDQRSRTRHRHRTPLWYYSTSQQFWRGNYKELQTSTREIQPFKISSQNSPADLQQQRYHHCPCRQELRTCWLGHWNLCLLGIRWAPHWRQYLCANLRAGSPTFCYQTLSDNLQVDTREPYVQQLYQGRHHLHSPLDPQESKWPLRILLSNDKNPQGQRRNPCHLLWLCKPRPSPWKMAKLYTPTRPHLPTFLLRRFFHPEAKTR